MLDGERYTKRCERWNATGHAHELTFSCYMSRPFLARERTCQYLVDAVNAATEKHEFDLWAYVFMADHVHLVVCPRQEVYSISTILLAIKQPVSQRAIRYLREHNPAGLRVLATGQQARPYRFWQKGGGYDRNITKVKTLIETVRYIHNNPVRKGLVETPEQWHYSSAAEWEGVGPGPLAINRDRFPTF
jgi:putative transposase